MIRMIGIKLLKCLIIQQDKFDFNIQGVPRNTTVAEGLEYLKLFTAFIHEYNFRSKILELIITKYP